MVLIVVLSPVIGMAQSKDDVHQFFERQVAAINAEKSKHTNPGIELVRVNYDRGSTTLGFLYRVDLAVVPNKMSSNDEKLVVRSTLVNGACSGNLAVFMRAHNLQLIHVYQEKNSSREVAKFQISKKDC